MKFEISKEEYAKEHFADEDYQKGHLTPDIVWETYHRDIFPFLSVITDFRLHDADATQEEIRVALGIPHKVWRIAKKTFSGLDLALKSKKSLMKFKAQLDLQKGIMATEHKNPKMIEMQGLRYDDDWKSKGDKQELELPKIQIEFTNAQVSDGYFED